MRVLILGGSGMLGHKLWQNFRGCFDTYVTFRGPAATYERFGIFEPARSLGQVSAFDFDSVVRAFIAARPAAVVNCIGVVKQDAAAKDPFTSISINALFPHRLAALCRAAGARLIHLSTDCVFSGRQGRYTEADRPDAEDLYGRTKLLGEVGGEGCLTVRTSMIGRELSGSHGLVEWFLGEASRGRAVRGFRRAVFSGFTTGALADILARLVAERPHLSGVWNVAAEPINKFDLLTHIKQSYGLGVEIEPDETFVCDRSLDGSRFAEATDFGPPSWPEMIAGMRDDATPYDEMRKR